MTPPTEQFARSSSQAGETDDRYGILALSSDNLPVRQRVALLRESHARTIIRHHLEPFEDETFHFNAELHSFPGLGIAFMECSATRADRTAADVSADSILQPDGCGRPHHAPARPRGHGRRGRHVAGAIGARPLHDLSRLALGQHPRAATLARHLGARAVARQRSRAERQLMDGSGRSPRGATDAGTNRDG